MKKDILAVILFAIVTGLALPSCTRDPIPQGEDSEHRQEGNTDEGNNSSSPNFDSTITPYNGEKADDISDDIVGNDVDLYWEANNFTEKVNVVFEGTSASVTTSNESVLYHKEGAYVTIDLLSNSVKDVEITVSGKSEDGQLKIYGEKKFKLTLNGVELVSSVGPAINNQCKKRVFVHLADDTTNRLTDASSYSSEACYLNGASAEDEDRKGCFFSEGHLIFSGSGVLIVDGMNKHGIATDGYMFVRPGVTLVVNDAARNAIHVKGDEEDGIGIHIQGGLIYANTSAVAGKCMKTDLDVNMAGGKLLFSTSGISEYDSEEKDVSSPACIKADRDVSINGGIHVLKSTGTGGKGINVDGAFRMYGGTVTVTTTGGKYTYNKTLGQTASPKGVKADGDITIDGGSLNISVTGASDGSEGIESKTGIYINGGELFVHAYDDAMNASKSININGGKVCCLADNNDGIDSNGTLSIAGGLVISSGATGPEEAFDCDNSNNFKITGGTLIGTGGSSIAPSGSSTQRSVIYNGISATSGKKLCILDSSGEPLMTYEFPRTMSSISLFFSSPGLTDGTYSVSTGGTLSGAEEGWNGYQSGGSWSDGTQLGTFTSSGIVTTVGGSQGGGNTGGWPGGGPGGRP
ncbi:MAG: carbohydrate-binding domain-containing protein [Candidatus Cryptobacteroides sp.]